MACSSVVGITRLCGTSLVPGSEKLWLVAHKDLYAVSGTDVYISSTASNLVTSIGVTSSASYVEIGYLRDSAGFDSEGTVDPTKGVAFSTNTLVFKLGDVSVENKVFLDSIMTQPVSAILKLRSGKYFALGLGGLFQLTAFQATSGKSSGDEVSYTLTFNEIDSSTPRQVDPTLISSITS